MCNSVFHDNIGVTISLVKQKILLNGEALFLNNSTKDGAGIYINDHSTVVFGENANIITFIHNFANTAGGAIFSTNNSDIIFNQNSNVKFSHNSARIYGAVIYSLETSHVIFTENSNVEFSSNVNNKQLCGIIYI